MTCAFSQYVFLVVAGYLFFFVFFLSVAQSAGMVLSGAANTGGNNIADGIFCTYIQKCHVHAGPSSSCSSVQVVYISDKRKQAV